MSGSSIVDRLIEAPTVFFGHVLKVIAGLLLSASSTWSIGSLIAALMIASAWLARRHLARGGSIRGRALLRLLFPRRWFAARSTRLDFELLLLNTFVFGVVFAGAVFSADVVGRLTGHLLVATFGQPSPAALPDLVCSALLTMAVFLAYELAYWVHHYLAHTVPALWEMHKVHHSAEVLTPLTNARVHPVESIILLNMMALFIGVTEGVVIHLLGHPVSQLSLAGTNALIVLGTYTLAHLHHTHVWISFTGTLGRIFVSPAHHQVHHSANPIHFNKNMGSILAIWDWLFGTLYIPAAKRERLTFGLGDGEITEHSVTQELFRPVRALAGLMAEPKPSAPATRPAATGPKA
ncbi:MAG: sterol desaturase family protein [Proteobacteria bacterium]|nr:sterol desaturase family protein [Pseudomonadota bacterium]